MVEHLIEFDYRLFYLINVAWSSAFLDYVMPLVRNKFIWAPVYMFLATFLLLNYKMDGVITILYLILTVFLTDQISSNILKPLLERIRPCHVNGLQEYIHVLVNCGSGFSFPSSHASNHFGVAFFVGLMSWRLNRIILPIGFLWAFVISYAQVYVGVHYPLDVAGGALLGIVIGIMMAVLCRQFSRVEI